MITKVDKVLKAVNDSLEKNRVKLDGVVEPFNDGKEKGMILKIYDKYNENLDICFWVYQPSDRVLNNEMRIMFGHHCDCLNNNLWKEELPYETVTSKTLREMHELARNIIVDKINQYIEKEICFKI